jgi:PIN domain nuclease of toxin-antitoxin system
VIYVLDACAMIAYLKGEQGGATVERLLRDPRHTCYAHAINLCEVYYDFIRSANEETAEAAITDLVVDGVAERGDMDPALWRDAGRLKAGRRLSLADAIGVSLARRLGGDFVTSDHHEFDALVAAGLAPILFIR